MTTAEQRVKAQATRAKNKAMADDTLRANLKTVKATVNAVISKCAGSHFLDRRGGQGVSCFVWFTAEVSDGRKTRRIKDCCSANSLVIDANFDRIMSEIPGVVSHHINLD